MREQVLELIQRLQTSHPSDDATSIKSAASNADSGRGASDEGDVRQRLLRATGSGQLNITYISSAFSRPLLLSSTYLSLFCLFVKSTCQ